MKRLSLAFVLTALALLTTSCANEAELSQDTDPYTLATFALDDLVFDGHLEATVDAYDLVAEGRVQLIHVLDYGALSVELEWEDPNRLESLLANGPLKLHIEFSQMETFLARPEIQGDIQEITRDTVSHALRDPELATFCGTRKLMATGTIDIGEGPEAVVFGFEYLEPKRYGSETAALSVKKDNSTKDSADAKKRAKDSADAKNTPKPKKKIKDGTQPEKTFDTKKRADKKAITNDKLAKKQKDSGKTFSALDPKAAIDWPFGVAGCPLSKGHKKCNKGTDCKAWLGPFEWSGSCGKAWIICDCFI